MPTSPPIKLALSIHAEVLGREADAAIEPNSAKMTFKSGIKSGTKNCLDQRLLGEDADDIDTN